MRTGRRNSLSFNAALALDRAFHRLGDHLVQVRQLTGLHDAEDGEAFGVSLAEAGGFEKEFIPCGDVEGVATKAVGAPSMSSLFSYKASHEHRYWSAGTLTHDDAP